MTIIQFSATVCAELQYYVYRLIDPRNGETFYVGKGKDNRVFEHARGELGANAGSSLENLQRIRSILLQGLEVSHVIHRHGMDEKTAFEVEAALIDAYPNGNNLLKGRDHKRGLMHSKQIIERYAPIEAEFRHKAILIKIKPSTELKSVYETVRYAWILDLRRAERAEIVLAVVEGLIVGVFIPKRWLRATAENFPGRNGEADRFGFEGNEASDDIANLYLRRQIPPKNRQPGAANPIMYTYD